MRRLALSIFLILPTALALATLKVMEVGDSITMGAGSPGGYRGYLAGYLASKGVSVEFTGQETSNAPPGMSLRHEGHSSWRTMDLLNGLAEAPDKGNIIEWIVRDQPDAICLMIGTNDAMTPMDVQSSDYVALIDAIHSAKPDCHVFFSSVPKSDPSLGRTQWELNVNVIIGFICRIKSFMGYAISFVDNYSDINPETDLSDLIHPNANGYHKIAKRFCRAMVPFQSLGFDAIG